MHDDTHRPGQDHDGLLEGRTFTIEEYADHLNSEERAFLVSLAGRDALSLTAEEARVLALIRRTQELRPV